MRRQRSTRLRRRGASRAGPAPPPPSSARRPESGYPAPCSPEVVMWWCWLGLAFAGGDPDLLPDDDSGAPASGGIGGISMGRANPLPPAPAVPDGRVIRRYGEARWSTGSPITWMAVSPDGQ